MKRSILSVYFLRSSPLRDRVTPPVKDAEAALN